ncbi:hypothetical protein O3W52_24135 [Ensifer psoraleae]|uniref:Uncharacterized protein n=1 Tax=Sinorhizobium psoraleae TaxID=520838 RepID=A0ABT4KQ54_9HYPH|nr:hypothetical protein [Sinorhizobium psoraleae]
MFSAIPHSHSSDGGDQGFLNVVRFRRSMAPGRIQHSQAVASEPSESVNINDVKVLHFVGENPWDTYQNKPEFTHLESIWSSFMEKEDWRHAFWMNKSFISKRWGKNGNPAKAPEEKVSNFEKRLNGYGPIRRTVVKWGDILLPDVVAKPIDRTLKRIGIL